MREVRPQRGFTLVAAIFLIVVVAAMAVYMVNIRVVQQTTLVYGLQGARAMQAARSGIEWGIHEALVLTPGCPAPSTFTVPAGASSNFAVTVACSESSHTEATTTITTYQITAIARSGSFGSLDYVQRRMQATVSVNPPYIGKYLYISKGF